MNRKKPMTLRRLACSVLLASLALVHAPAQSGQMGLDEIRPGMVGVGRTVFEGTRVEEFKVNILGVLENVIGTHRNLILAKLEGGPPANPRPNAAKVHIDFPLTRENLDAAFRRALNWNRPFADRPGDAMLVGASAINGV